MSESRLHERRIVSRANGRTLASIDRIPRHRTPSTHTPKGSPAMQTGDILTHLTETEETRWRVERIDHSRTVDDPRPRVVLVQIDDTHEETR